MNYEELNNRYYPKVNDAIRSIYEKRMKNLKHNILREYYLELSNYILSLKNRLYSLLSIAIYNALNDEKDDRIIIPSIGIEFLQNSRVIHDDLILKNNFHDSEPSFHYRFQNYHSKFYLEKMSAEDFGNNMGLLGGNSAVYLGLEAFFFNNFEIEQNLKAIEYYEKLSHQIAESMLIEINVINNQFFNISDYIKIISLKTGALVEKSLLIGANYANIENENKKKISKFGINLGVLFQIVKDFLIIYNEKYPIELLLNNHVRESRVPLFLFKSFNKLNENDLSILSDIIEIKNFEGVMSQNDGVLLQEVDIVEDCKEFMILYFENVKDAFDKVRPLINEGGIEFFDDLMKSYIEPIFEKKI